MMLSIKEFLDRYGEDTTSNFQLLHYAKELGIKPFKVIMRNELYKLKKTKKNYIICNYHTTEEPGIHWVAIYKDTNKDLGYYFNSYGKQPFKEAIDFLNVKNRFYSSFKIQSDGMKLCGQLSLYVLYRLSKGYDFFDIILDLNKTIKI